jgi:hypothetical protein
MRIKVLIQRNMHRDWVIGLKRCSAENEKPKRVPAGRAIRQGEEFAAVFSFSQAQPNLKKMVYPV